MNTFEMVEALTNATENNGAIHALIKQEINCSGLDPEDICRGVCVAMAIYRGDMQAVINASDDQDDARKAVNNTVGYCNQLCKKELGWGFKCTSKPSAKNPNKDYIYTPVEVQAKSEDSDKAEPESEPEVVVPKSCAEQVAALVHLYGIAEVGQAVKDIIEAQKNASE